MKWFFFETPASWNELKWPQVDSSEVSLDVFDVDFTLPFDAIHFFGLSLMQTQLTVHGLDSASGPVLISEQVQLFVPGPPWSTDVVKT